MSEIYAGKGNSLLRRVIQLERENSHLKELMTPKVITNKIILDDNILTMDNFFAVLVNNSVQISIIIPANIKFSVMRFHISDKKLFPVVRSNGIYSSSSSSQDKCKINGAGIDTKGEGYIYMNDILNYNESVTFIYSITGTFYE